MKSTKSLALLLIECNKRMQNQEHQLAKHGESTLKIKRIFVGQSVINNQTLSFCNHKQQSCNPIILSSKTQSQRLTDYFSLQCKLYKRLRWKIKTQYLIYNCTSTMDYGTESVGVCYCFLFVSYKHYLFCLVASGILQGACIATVGVLSLIEFDYRLAFTFPVQLSLIIYGGLHLLLQFFDIFSLVRSSVFIFLKISVFSNALTSLLDLAAGTLLLAASFATLDFLSLTKQQQTYLRTESAICQVVAGFLIFFGLFGFWLTYLQHQTIDPYQESLQKATQVQPELTLKQAFARRFNSTYMQDLTPKINQPSSNGETQDYIQLRANRGNNQGAGTPMRLQVNPSKFKSDNVIQVAEKSGRDNEDQFYYPPSTQTIRLPSQVDEIKPQKRDQVRIKLNQ